MELLADRDPEEKHLLQTAAVIGHEVSLPLLQAIAEMPDDGVQRGLARLQATVDLGMRPLQAHCHRGLGTLYATAGQREQAHTALATAIALYRDMDMTFWLPQVEAALAQVEGR